jgi:hypothetical protein
MRSGSGCTEMAGEEAEDLVPNQAPTTAGSSGTRETASAETSALACGNQTWCDAIRRKRSGWHAGDCGYISEACGADITSGG